MNNDKIQLIINNIEKNHFKVILILRYLGFYFDIVSYAAGMAKIKYKNFIVATFIGFIPYILIYVYAGTQLINIKSSDFIYSILYFKLIVFGIFVFGYGIFWLIKKNKNYNNKNYNNKNDKHKNNIKK